MELISLSVDEQTILVAGIMSLAGHVTQLQNRISKDRFKKSKSNWANVSRSQCSRCGHMVSGQPSAMGRVKAQTCCWEIRDNESNT